MREIHGPATRVLYVARFHAGGTITGLYDLVRGLDRRRFEPIVLFYEENPNGERFRDLGVAVRVLDRPEISRVLPESVGTAARRAKRRSRALRSLAGLVRVEIPRARRIARVIREEEIRLLYHNDNLRAHRASVIAGILTGRPQICHVRSWTEHFAPLDRRLAKRVDFFLYMSAAIEEHVRRELRVPAPKGRVIYDPFDLSPYDEALESPRSRIREELGFTDAHRVVCHVGRIVRWKGQDHFLRAMAEVVETHPEARALLVGGDDDRPASRAFRRKLEELAARPPLRGRVVFAGHRVDVARIMAASDVIVHSSSEPEPFGRVVVEGMATARPVVAASAGGVPEIIRDGETGLLTPPADPSAMAGAISWLLAHPGEGRRIGARARREVETRFAAPAQIDAMQEVYEQVLGGSGHPDHGRARGTTGPPRRNEPRLVG